MNIVTKFDNDNNVVITYRPDMTVSYFTHRMREMDENDDDIREFNDDNMPNIRQFNEVVKRYNFVVSEFKEVVKSCNEVVKMSNMRGDFIRTVLYNMDYDVEIDSLRQTFANDVIGNIFNLKIGRQDLMKTKKLLDMYEQENENIHRKNDSLHKHLDDSRIEIENYKKQIETLKKEKDEIMEAWIKGMPRPIKRQNADDETVKFLERNKEKSFKKIKF
tara:strand:- start:1570 stop:2223 length:654 start_codon:yes stop_codon:yes gene_type:complete